MIEYAAIIATLAAGSGWLVAFAYMKDGKVYRSLWADRVRLTVELQRQLQDALDSSNRQADCIGGLQSCLQEIADQETPSANATVKRMAAIARREA